MRTSYASKLANVDRIFYDANKVFEQQFSIKWYHQMFNNTYEHRMCPILQWRILKIDKSGVEMAPGDKSSIVHLISCCKTK